MVFMYIGDMYSGENDVCAWCYSEFISTSGELKNMPDHGGNRLTYDLCNTRPNALPNERRVEVGSGM